jgi:hypothetical protein
VEKKINIAIDRDKIIDCLRNVSDKCDDFLNQELTKTNDLNYYRGLAISFLFVKSIKTFRSLIILLENKKHEDAQILLRSLIENQIVSRWLQLKGDVGFLKFWRCEVVSKIRQHHKSLWETQVKRDQSEFDYLLAQADVENELKKIDDMIKEIEPSFDRTRQEELDKKGWCAGINVKTMAGELSELSKDPDWRWKYDIPYDATTQYVHPNPIIIGDFLFDNGIIVKPKICESTDIVAVSALASQIVIRMIENFNDRFNLGKNNIIEKLNNELNVIFSEN